MGRLKAMRIKRIAIIVILLRLAVVLATNAQEPNRSNLTTPQGVRMLNNKSFDDSPAARKEILELYKDLRIADVLDAMELLGLAETGLMDKDIVPLWRDVENFTHRIVGFAITVRYVPANIQIGQNSFPDVTGFSKWISDEYKRVNFEAWTAVIKEGDVAVIDASGIEEGSHTGSYNSLVWAKKGLVGVVANGGVRDTDEIIKVKKVAVYCKNGHNTRGIVPGRLLCESFNYPISCGGVLVFPGDLIVGGGDGVIVVPRERVVEVGKIALGINIEDEKARGKRYKELGMKPDETIKTDEKSKREKQIFTMAACSGASGLAGSGILYETSVEPTEEDRYLSADYRVWIPKKAKILRGIIVHQHGCGRNGITMADDVHWQALAEKHDCVLMGTYYKTGKNCADWYDPDNGTEKAFLKSIKNLAVQTGHSELVNVPWILWGHSGGASWILKMTSKYPNKVVAAFSRSLPFKLNCDDSQGLLNVPLLLSMGKAESRGRFLPIWEAGHHAFKELRAKNGLVVIAVDPKAEHDCRYSRLLAIPFFDVCMSQRLPEAGQFPEQLKPMNTSIAWLGNPNTLEIASADQYIGDTKNACWLPNQEIAQQWQEFVRTGWIADITPPEPPSDIKADVVDGKEVILTWQAQADLQSGLKSFNIYRNGKKIGRHQSPKSKYNKKGEFQMPNFGDEPSPVHPIMKFVDRKTTMGKIYHYQVTTINLSNLESEKSDPLVVTVTSETDLK